MAIFESLLKIPLFEPQPGLMIWTVISFTLLLAVLAKVGFKPLADIIKKREDSIRGSIDEAEKVRQEAEKLLNNYKKQLAEARKESHEIIKQGKKIAENVKTEIVAKADREAKQIVENAKLEIDRERARAIEELEAKVTDLTVLMTAKVVNKMLDSKDHMQLIEESLSEVKDLD